MQTLSIFGVTGSIGCSTLKVVDQHLDRFNVVCVTAGSNAQKLAETAIKYQAEHAVIADASKYDELKTLLADHSNISVSAGADAMVQAAKINVDIFMAAIVGNAGLKPTITALKYAKRVALANKECLVTAGNFFMEEAKKHGCEILPVDSEHSAMFQSLVGSKESQLEKIMLTASGGPFRKFTMDQMKSITVAQALNHPNWDMGAKITIDSATLMNKGNEFIEAYHLFDVELDQIEVVVHPQSIIHSMMQFQDGSVMAQLGTPEMGTAIAYAMSYPDRFPLDFKRLDLFDIARLDFEPADEERFKCLALAKYAAKAGGTCGAVLNAANEIAVNAFLQENLSFLNIANLCEAMVELADQENMLYNPTRVEEIYEIDQHIRSEALKKLPQLD